MSVTSETCWVEYTANGYSQDFPTTFFFSDEEHLVVTVTPDGGTPTVQTLGADYTVTGEGGPLGGEVSFLSPPAANATVLIERTVDIVQETNFRAQGNFSPNVHEDALDYRTFVDQQLSRRITDLEAQGTMGDAVAGAGLTKTGDVWAVGAGDGVVVADDDVSVDYGVAGDMVAVTRAAAAAGTSAKVARIDHKHDASCAAPAATGVATAATEGSASTLARSDHAHKSNTTPANITVAAAAIGTSGEPARADHKHNVDVEDPVELHDDTASEGTSEALSRADHVHPHGERGGDLLHAAATTSVAGFMSATDKTKLDELGDKTFSGDAFTSSATPTNVATYAMTNGKCETIEVVVAAMRSTGGEAAAYHLRGTFRRLAGVVTQVGTTTVLASHEDVAGWDCVLGIVGIYVVVQVTGADASAIYWHCVGKVVRADMG